MMREIRVVKCSKCQMMIADFVKKSNKWQCKICGEKQSVITEYGRGSGQYCRLLAQKLNNKKVEMDCLFNVDLSLMVADDECELDNFEINNLINENLSQDENENENRLNKWLKYIEEPDEEKCESENDTFSSIGMDNYENSETSTQSNKRLLEDVTNSLRPSKIRKLSKYPESTITSNQMNEVQSSKYHQGDRKNTSKMIPEATIISNQMNELDLSEDYEEIVVYPDIYFAEPRTPEPEEHNKSWENSKWAKYLTDKNEEEEKKEEN